MNDVKQEALEVVSAKLDEREQYALTAWQNSEHAPLSIDTNAKLFRLYLNGKSTHQIHKMNAQFSLGQIVHARIRGEWDRRVEEHLDELLGGVKARVQQVTLETIDFFADLISAANTMHGEAIKKYLQTRDPKDLGELQITSLGGYKQAIELFQKLTGQDKVGSKSELVVTHKADGTVQDKLPSPSEAAELLRLLAVAAKKE